MELRLERTAVLEAEVVQGQEYSMRAVPAPRCLMYLMILQRSLLSATQARGSE